MKKPRNFLHIICFCFLLLSGCSTTNTETPNDTSITNIPTPTPTFEQFTTNIFVEEVSADTISLHYSLSNPENYGVSNYPITLGSVSDAVSFDENAVDLYEQLSAYDISTLSKENALTFQVLERHLNLMMQANFSSYLSELLGPTTGYQAQLPILLAEYRFDSKQDVEYYLNLLPCVYDYFKEIAKFQKEKSEAGYFMNDNTAKEIIAQCEDFCKNPDDNFLVSTFEERLETLSLTAVEQADFLSRNQTALYTYVFPAYDLLIDTLTECLGTGTNEYGLSYFEGGKEFTNDTIDEVLNLCAKNHIKGLSILGGEPMHPNNIEGTTKLAKAFKEKYPNKNVWVWSGFKFDEYLKDKEVLNYIDVLVDGTYNDELHDPTLKWRGSSNQRVIDVKESLKNKEISFIN